MRTAMPAALRREMHGTVRLRTVKVALIDRIQSWSMLLVLFGEILVSWVAAHPSSNTFEGDGPHGTHKVRTDVLVGLRP